MAEQDKTAQRALPLDVKNPEVQAAIAVAVAAEMAKLGPAAFLNAGVGGTASPDSAFAHSLALALAEFNEQGGGKKYVDPKILTKRREANDKMWDLIRQAHLDGKVATYGLTHKVVLDDQLIEPFYLGADRSPQQTVIDWNGAPNGAMVPINDIAKEIHAAFSASISSDDKLPHKAMAMTPGGLVVHGGAAGHNRNAERLSKLAAASDPAGLSIHHKSAAGGKPMHVLGTIAPPVQEISAGAR